jgi:hypothetical protein
MFDLVKELDKISKDNKELSILIKQGGLLSSKEKQLLIKE